MFNVIDELHLPADAFKANEKRRILFEHEIVTLWRKTMDTEIDDRTLRFDIGVSLFDPNGAVSQRIITPLVFESKKRRVRLRIQLDGLQVSQSGDYLYRLEALEPNRDTREYFDIPFEVKART